MDSERSEQREPKPYPRRCAGCGEVSLRRARIQHLSRVKNNGQLIELRIDDLLVDRCEECGEVFFTNETADAHASALAEFLGACELSEGDEGALNG